MSGLLGGLRVLDLTDERARLAGRAFADLGAEVVVVEADPATDDLSWRVERAGTTVVPGLTHELLAGADIVLAHESRAGRAPQAVWVCVTPYGLTGPRAAWRGSDLTTYAAATAMYPTGDPDRAPLRASQPASHAHTAGEVVTAALTALASGAPQDVDLSVQEALLVTQMTAPSRWPQEHNRGKRRGPVTGRTRETWACADGWVSFGLRGGPARVKNLQMFTALAIADGVATPTVSERDWTSYDPKDLSDDELREIEAVVAACFAKHTMRELYDHAVATGLMLAPANNAADLIASRQLRARGSLVPLGDIPVVPRAFVRTESVDGPAPELVGLRGEAHRGSPQWTARPVPYSFARTPGRAWEGLKIVEFGSGAAGPIAARYFADHGATVIRIESRTKPDFLRQYSASALGLEGSAFFCGLNAGKLDLSLNMRDPRAVALAKRLCVEWADAVLENFAPGAMAKWGLDWESLKKERPDLVMASGCLWGNSGPEKNYPGFGGQGAALSGYTHLTGWPDRSPVGPAGTITDSLAPRYVAAGLAAGLLHQKRTGLGVWLDVSQVEAAVWTLGSWIATESATGASPGRMGNRHVTKAPHGAFACADVPGEAGSGSKPVRDRWVALAVHDDDDWSRLAELIGAEGFATTDERLAKVDEVEALVTAWTSQRTPTQAAEALQAAGLDAYEVVDWGDVHTDPQLLERKHFVELVHPVIGPHLYEENGFRLSASGGGVVAPGPLIGQHTEHVLVDLLGLDRAEVQALTDDHVLD